MEQKKREHRLIYSGSDALLHIFGQVMTGSSRIVNCYKDNHEFPKATRKKAIFARCFCANTTNCALRRQGGGDTDVGAASFVSRQLFGRNRGFACSDTDEMDEWFVSRPKNGIKGRPVAAGII